MAGEIYSPACNPIHDVTHVKKYFSPVSPGTKRVHFSDKMDPYEPYGLPIDIERAAKWIETMTWCGLTDTWYAQTSNGDTVQRHLKHIVENVNRQLFEMKTTGVYRDNPDNIIFLEVGVSDPRGSTVDVKVWTTEALGEFIIVRIHHGEDNKLTYHLPRHPNTYNQICDKESPGKCDTGNMLFALLRLYVRTFGPDAHDALLEALDILYASL